MGGRERVNPTIVNGLLTIVNGLSGIFRCLSEVCRGFIGGLSWVHRMFIRSVRGLLEVYRGFIGGL